MWAFAIFNTKNYKLILSRDRFGEKPLYYKKTNHGIYFGSEIGYIKNLENKSLKLNIIKFRIFAKYGYNSVFLDDKTFFKKVNSLEPSKNLFLIKNKIKIKKYWFLEKLNVKNLNEKSNIKKIKKLLNLSVSKRLRTDVNNSLYLSGGIDSSGILSMCKKKITTFSISNVTSKIYDEKNIIDKNVKFFDVKNYMHEVKKIDLLNEFKELSKKYQSPILNINSLPQYYLNKKIRNQGFKVVLSGIGADEIFAGYYDHFLHYLNSIKKSKNLFNKNLNLFKNLILPKIRNSDFKDLSRINNPIYSRIRERNEFNIAVKKIRLKKNIIKKSFKSSIKNALIYQLKECLYPGLYNDDLNAMSTSIENRSPYLDSSIVKSAFEMDSKFYMKNLSNKYILREALKFKILPEIYNNKFKIGYNFNLNNFPNLNKSKILKLIDKNTKSISKIYNKVYLSNYIKSLNFIKLNNEQSKFLFRVISIVFFIKYSKLCEKN